MDKPGTSALTLDVLENITALCEAIYCNRCISKNKSLVVIDQYLVGGQMLAHVELNPTREDAFVVFRGTKITLGHLLLINFQAYLRDAPPELGEKGKIHQGFYRAMWYLWYGKDAPKLPKLPAETEPLRRFVSTPAVVLTAIVGVFVRLFSTSWGIAGLVFLASYGIVLGFQHGVWEGLLRKSKVQLIGRSLATYQVELAKHAQVWFIGHSLGGALALLSFVAYSQWCKINKIPNTARLVTFGMPRVGDRGFTDFLESEHAERLTNIIHKGDPITEMPVSSFSSACALFTRGLLGVLLAILYVPWRAYLVAYGSPAYCPCRVGVLPIGESAILSFSKHKMKTYSDLVT